ncbi:hypothetical protein CAPTEDRAFT_112191, partial [Capitella teleta]
SQTLVNATLIQAGMRARRLACTLKPLLTDRHRDARLNWARTHLQIQDAHWQNVVFNDGARFGLYVQDDRNRIRWRKHELYSETCVQAGAQSGGSGPTI